MLMALRIAGIIKMPRLLSVSSQTKLNDGNGIKPRVLNTMLT